MKARVRKESLPFAKYFISPGRRHGSPPFSPIPFDRVAATIAVSEGVCWLILLMYLRINVSRVRSHLSCTRGRA
jgi:hypothetical protein